MVLTKLVLLFALCVTAIATWPPQCPNDRGYYKYYWQCNCLTPVNDKCQQCGPKRSTIEVHGYKLKCYRCVCTTNQKCCQSDEECRDENRSMMDAHDCLDYYCDTERSPPICKPRKFEHPFPAVQARSVGGCQNPPCIYCCDNDEDCPAPESSAGNRKLLDPTPEHGNCGAYYLCD